MTSTTSILKVLPAKVASTLTMFAMLASSFAGLAAIPSVAFAASTTHTVCASGCNFSTIQAAINSSSTNDGDTIQVSAGTYTGTVNINKPLTIKGVNAGTAGNATPRSEESVINQEANITVGGVTLNGFSFTNSGGQVNITSTTTLSDIVLENNIFSGYSSVGILTNNAGNLIIQKNLFENVSGSGEAMQIKSNSATKSCTGTQVLNNTFNGASNNGGADINFSCNLTTSYTTSDFSSNVTVAGNTTTGEDASFMSFSGIAGVKIHDNTATGITGNSAIYFFGSVTGAVAIENNHVTGGRSNAVSIGGSNTGTFTITNNDFSSNANGISVASGALTGSGAVDAHSNNLSGNTNGANNGGTPVVDATNNWWGNASGPGDKVSGDSSTPDINTSGTGAAAVGAVNYSDWCSNAACSPPASSSSFTSSAEYIRAKNNTSDTAATALVPAAATEARFTYAQTDGANVYTNVAGAEHTQSDQFPVPSTGQHQYRGHVGAVIGTYAVTGEFNEGGNWYPITGDATLSVLGTPTGSFILPSASSHMFRPNDNPARITVGDTNNSFKQVKFTIDSKNYIVNRAACDLREEGNRVLCDVKSASNWTSSLAEGTYTATTTITNQAQNSSTITSQSFTIDATRPTLSNLVLTPVQTSYDGSVTASADASDNNAVKNVTFSVTAPRASDQKCDGNGAALAKVADTVGASGTYSGTLDLSGISNGAYCVNAVAEDTAANHSLPILRKNITVAHSVDNSATATSLTITAPAHDGDTASGTYTFKALYDNGVASSLDWAIRSGANTSCSGGTTVAGNVDGHTDASTLSSGTFSTTLDTSTFGGDGNYCFVVNDGHNHRPIRAFAVDNVASASPAAPAAPTITAPTGNSVFTSEPITNSWTTVTDDTNGNTDANGIVKYQVAYIYDDGHTFSGSTCSATTTIDSNTVSGCRDTTSTSRNHTPTTNEQGGVTIYVRAIDGAGNVSAWSTPVYYTYDKNGTSTSGGNGGSSTAASVTTDPASPVATSTATIVGTNGSVAAKNAAFWWGTTSAGPFATSTNPGNQLPNGWQNPYASAPLANASFNSALTGLTPNTIYYYVAWVKVAGVWYPGAVESFSTEAIEPPSAYSLFYSIVHPSDIAIDHSHWYFYDDATDQASAASGDANHRITANPVTIAGDTGAVELNGTNGNKMDLATFQYSGTKLRDIASIGYSTFQPTSNTSGVNAAPFLGFDVDFGTTTSPSYAGRLNYVPGASTNLPQPVQDQWQHYEGVATSTGNMWTWSHFATNGNKWPDNNTSEYRSWSDIVAAFPNAEINGQLAIRAGDPYSGTFYAYIDHVYLAVSGSNPQYDFELAGSTGGTTSTGGGSSGSCALARQGDINCDGTVNFLDFALLMGTYSLHGSNITNNKADLDNNGAVDANDLATLLAHWTV